MERDYYLEACAIDYGLRLIKVFEEEPSEDYLKYVHSRLGPGDRAWLNKTFLRLAAHSAARSRQQLRATLLKEAKEVSGHIKYDSLYADKLETYFTSTDPRAYPKFLSELSKLLKRIKERKLKLKAPSLFLERLSHLNGIFGLSEKESELVTFYFLLETNKQIESLFSNEPIELKNLRKSARAYCRFFEINSHELGEIFKENGALLRSGIPKKDREGSLFTTREAATRSWEVTQTNELLCQMENFSGVLACATNFVKNLDPAVMRRFGYKIRFDYLTKESGVLLFNRVLGPLLGRDATPEEVEKISRLQRLTPGDFKVVYQKHFLHGSVNSSALIADLANEVRIKTIGAQKSIQGLQG